MFSLLLLFFPRVHLRITALALRENVPTILNTKWQNKNKKIHTKFLRKSDSKTHTHRMPTHFVHFVRRRHVNPSIGLYNQVVYFLFSLKKSKLERKSQIESNQKRIFHHSNAFEINFRHAHEAK